MPVVVVVGDVVAAVVGDVDVVVVVVVVGDVVAAVVGDVVVVVGDVVGAESADVVAELDDPVTRIAKAGSEIVVMPSLTIMMMFEYRPTWLLRGVPVSSPVEVLMPSHAGLFLTVKRRVW